MEVSDLVFVTTLSDDELGKKMDDFCEELSLVLNSTKGIVFAGNSFMFNNESIGCIYSKYFDSWENM